MSSNWNHCVTEWVSEQGSPVLPETPATTTTGVEPGSSYGSPPSEGLTSLHFNTTSSNSSYSSEAPTDTGDLVTLASTYATGEQTASNASTSPSTAAPDSPHARLAEDIDCVIFDSNSYVGSPTINIDSDDATGATSAIPDNMFRPQQPPSAVAYPPQVTHARRRERVTHFGSGTVVGSPTINIRSARATGARETIVPSSKQNY